MSALETLIAWIRVAELDLVKPEEVCTLVAATLDEVGESDPAYDLLMEIEEAASDHGNVPFDKLKSLLEQHGAAANVSDGEQLVEEFWALAEQLSDDEWMTIFYLELVEAVRAYGDGNEDVLPRFVSAQTTRLQEGWQAYSQSNVLPEEITAETALGHQLLVEGYQGWHDALATITLAIEEGTSFDDGLSEAEDANRLLVASQKLALRVNQDTSPF